MSEVLDIIPEVKDEVRKFLGLGKTVEDIATKIDLTQRELIDVKKLIQTVKPEPYQTLQAFIKRISSSSTKFDTATATYEFLNEFDKDMRLLSFIIVPDTQMKTTGQIYVSLNGNDFVAATLSGDFTDIAAIDIPIPFSSGKLFKRRQKLRVHLWTSTGTVTATLIFTLGQYF